MDQQQPKTNLTNSTYQSQFLPLVEHANNEIKKLVVYYAIYNKSRYLMQVEIEKVIQDLEARLPQEIKDRQSYVDGLRISANRMIREFYTPTINNFAFFITAIILAGFKAPKAPKDLYTFINKAKPSQVEKINEQLRKTAVPTRRTPERVEPNIWAEHKGVPYVENYPKRLREKLNGMAKTDIAPYTEGKKPITIWQKAELDIRHDNQMEMVDNLRLNGNVLCWISSHPDCSKRCAKWQGKLVDIQHHAEMSGFRMRNKVDGYTVYSLVDIMAQKDKYGYENNIINGFNCRHHLTPYRKGTLPPTEYDEKTIKKEREINTNLRKMECEIRRLKQQANLYAMIDKKIARKLHDKALQLEYRYKKYAEANGFAWYKYRIQA